MGFTGFIGPIRFIGFGFGVWGVWFRNGVYTV